MTNSCALQDIQCGEYLTVYVQAFDDECQSPMALAPVAQTGEETEGRYRTWNSPSCSGASLSAPCTPQNVAAVKDCSPDAITVTWDLSNGAIFYMVMARGSGGAVNSCNSMDLTCKVTGLQCGTNYTVTVIASNFNCNSSESKSITTATAACPPSHVAASLNCDTNEAVISWLGSPTLNSYTATIVDENLGLLSCSSTTTSCSIPNLTCGRLYTATVCYHDGSCPCLPSTAVSFDSVPCGPANVQARVDCASGGLTLGWNASKNAEGYMTVITSSNTTRSYNSSQPTLSVNTLPCGLVYTVRVRSFNHTCLSFASVLPVTETPCVPSNVMVKRNCSQSFMELTWQASSGAKIYTAVAVGRDNVGHTCVSNTTWCRVDGLSCSQVYDVSVAAADDACTSAGSPAVKQPTVPCPPLQLNVSLDCSTNAAALTWSSSANALSYTGRAVSADGHSVTCDAGAALGCRLQGLLCDRDYNFTVSASDGSCHSLDSQPLIQSTAPCPLQNVTNTLDCTSNALTVSWAPRSRPVNCSARAVSRAGAEVLCSTQGSSCTLPSLKCGDQYNVTVKATSSTCEGPSSVATVVYSGVVDCPNNTLQMSWDAAAGAVSYMSTLRGPGNSSISCVTTDLRCLFPVLQCAQTYTLSVAALGSTCNSSNSNVVSARAAPCDPKNVTAVLNCVSGVATVSWGASAGAQYYTVLARSNGLVDSCSSSGTWCQLSQLQCGEDYTVTVLAGDGRCNSSILAKTNVTTAPCAPVIQSYNLDCSSNRAVVTWVQDKDAISVTVGAASILGYSTSCNSSNSSCVLADLQCGNTYTVQAAAQGLQCLSKPSSTFTIVTAPCTPAHVEFTYSCVSGIAVLTWDETLGRKSFYAVVQSGNNTAVCMTDQTDCSLPSLLCGTRAPRWAKLYSHAFASHPPGPCAPANVSTSLVCDNNTAAVSWQPSGAAAYYQVRALGRNGDVKQCNTSSTNCLLPNMVCSETYMITVSPYSATCKGIDSSPYNYVTGSCPPTNVQVSLRCDNNVAHVNWTAALKADLYVVTAVDLRTHNCTSSQTACDLMDLSCGVTSVVTVVTVERGCRSQPSLPVTFQSVICPPANVYGVTNCMNSDITVLWDPSPRSDVTYLLYSKQYRGANAYTYTTQQTSYVVTGLLCSNLYIFRVAARDSSCTSVLSDPTQIETAPCPPTNLTASTDCGTSMGTLSWVPSLYATSYTATATGNRNNHRASCSSNTTACSMKLVCGDQYSAVVVASSETCNSSTGANLTFNSAPCLPDKVTAQVNCTANSFAVQWRPGLGNPVSYTAIAIANNDTQSTCDSTGTSCTISSLKCGLTYGLVVTTSSVSCGTIEGSDYKVQSAPCKPNNVSVDLQCSTNVALVTWANAGPDQTQVVTAVDSRGGSTSCTSNSSSCTFNSLTCGESYVVSVAGHTNSCSSELAAAQGFNTAPCSPNHLTATVDCGTGITTVIWDAARGATSYTVYARGTLGSNAECNTTDTNCNFQNLACGQLYSISVVARHNSCISLVSGTFDFITGPCPQSNLNTTLDCSTNTATVFWRTGRGILYYNASAEALSAPSHSCSTNGSSCNITSLSCGQSYKVSVSGQGQNCPSPGQEWNMINTAPCPPINVTVISSCTSNTITVSWQASQGSASYVAVAENAQGQQWSCTTNSTSCQIPGLLCGQEYQVYVTGVDKQCNGARSQTKVIHTAPCVPYNIQNSLDCLSGVLNVTWQSTGYFLQFRTSVVSSKGQVSVCTTDKHQCVIPNLLCGLAYSVTVVAQDSTCNSSQSPVQQVYTAPCPPSSFLTTLNCSTGAVSVTWNGSEPGAVYVVTAVDTAGHQDNCTSTGGGCGLSTLQCGNEYNVSVTPFRNGCVGRTSPTTLIKTGKHSILLLYIFSICKITVSQVVTLPSLSSSSLRP
ncbi:uncharacterized protein LOC121202196 [Betta splendens]|uniref:Uncharacterized protein LOC121202196 n=1 Tax=Betta splendens TaxID=158456 RepID=A0A9W2XSK6_BETSP|nr:uncharacterized protein LOC121202196 [Betta splendens]